MDAPAQRVRGTPHANAGCVYSEPVRDGRGRAALRLRSLEISRLRQRLRATRARLGNIALSPLLLPARVSHGKRRAGDPFDLKAPVKDIDATDVLRARADVAVKRAATYALEKLLHDELVHLEECHNVLRTLRAELRTRQTRVERACAVLQGQSSGPPLPRRDAYGAARQVHASRLQALHARHDHVAGQLHMYVGPANADSLQPPHAASTPAVARLRRPAAGARCSHYDGLAHLRAALPVAPQASHL